jgi:hypothetical protein
MEREQQTNTFLELVDAVQENWACWKSWESVEHIYSIFGDLKNNEFKPVYDTFLRALIRDDGQNLHLYLQVRWTLEKTFIGLETTI